MNNSRRGGGERRETREKEGAGNLQEGEVYRKRETHRWKREAGAYIFLRSICNEKSAEAEAKENMAGTLVKEYGK